MTPKESPADYSDYSDYPELVDDCGQQAEESEIGHPSPERVRTANEVGSAIVHQLNGPLTALRLYVGEIRQRSDRFVGATDTDDGLRQIVENAFQETERICAMMRLIADTFEAPLDQETAVALGRDAISWWSRSGGPEGGANDPERAISIHELLTPREREVLDHISLGCSNKQGAPQMQIGPRTFESHRARIMRKLGARNGADLVRMVLGENPGAS
jgi:DNA-binding CsgD family transcriptional regulator